MIDNMLNNCAGKRHRRKKVKRSRSEVIEDIGRALPYLNNQDMMELSNKILGKL